MAKKKGKVSKLGKVHNLDDSQLATLISQARADENEVVCPAAKNLVDRIDTEYGGDEDDGNEYDNGDLTKGEKRVLSTFERIAKSFAKFFG